MRDKEKKKENNQYKKQVIELIKVAHKLDPSYILVTVIAAVLDALRPYITLLLSADIIDCLIQSDFRKAGILSAIMIIANLLCGSICDYLNNNVLAVKLSRSDDNLKILLRGKVFDIDYETMENSKTLEKISMTEYTSRLHGSIGDFVASLQKVLNDAITIVTSVVLLFVLIVSKPIKSSGILHTLATPVVSGLIYFSIVAIITLVQLRVARNFTKKERELIKTHANVELQVQYLQGQVIFNYMKGRTIRLFGMKDLIMDIFDKKVIHGTHDYYKGALDRRQKEEVTIECLDVIDSFFVYFIVLTKILTGAISVGSFAKYTGVMMKFSGSIANMVKDVNKVKQYCGFMQVFLDFMNLENKEEIGTLPITNKIKDNFEFEFHDVGFKFSGNEDFTLRHVNCILNSKTTTAVVGRNGAGKSTFIKLLCRLYDPTEGYITLNGKDIREYDYKEYIKFFGVVFQDFALFAFPMGENVAANTEYDEAKVWDSLEKSGMKEKMESFQHKLMTPLFKYDEGGVDLSGGESQKLAISRALYKDAQILILDEPTAALDPMSEAEIYKKLFDVSKDKTSVFISHRMSSCIFCDKILVFDKGNIVEAGSHTDLIKKNGYYSELWNAQAQYYKEDEALTCG